MKTQSIYEVRRNNLISYIADKHEGNRAEFCRATQKNPNLINLILTKNPEFQKNMGEKLARDLEKLCGLTPRWFDGEKDQPMDKTISIPIATGDSKTSGKLWLTILESEYKKLLKNGSTSFMTVVDTADSIELRAWAHPLQVAMTVPKTTAKKTTKL